jgi:hypothetical protein
MEAAGSRSRSAASARSPACSCSSRPEHDGYATARAIVGLRLSGEDRTTAGAFYRRALRWGAANGVLFVITLVVIVVANALVPAEPSAPSINVGAILAITAFEGIFGSLFAFSIGAVVGLVLATLDLAALRIARELVGSGG